MPRSYKKSKKGLNRILKTITESDSDSDDDSDINVRVVKNHIYFWCDVTKKTCLDLSLKLRQCYHAMNEYSMFGDDKIPIYIHINSDGGDADAALGVVDTMNSLMNKGATIVTIVEGSASSAATIISVCGSERRIRPNAYMRIHQFSTAIVGKKSDLDDEHNNLSKFEAIMLRIYKKHTNMTKSQLKKILGREIDLLPKMCIEKGLVDKVQE